MFNKKAAYLFDDDEMLHNPPTRFKWLSTFKLFNIAYNLPSAFAGNIPVTKFQVPIFFFLYFIKTPERSC